MPRAARIVAGALTRKGFTETSGNHRFFEYHRPDGTTTTIRTKISNGEREISKPLMSMMARQCRLTNQDFHSFVDCTISREKFDEMAFPPRPETASGG